MADWASQVLSAGQGSGPIDMSQEESALNRAAAGLKMTPQGKAGFYEKLYGEGNVATDREGRLFIKKGDRWTPENAPGFSFGDIADFSGVALQTLPAIATSPTIAGAAGGGAAGNVIRQGVSALMPGDDRMTLGERAGSLAMDTALSGGTQGLINAVTPMRVMGRLYNRAADTPTGREGAAASVFLGAPLPPGQETGNRLMLSVERMLRRNPAAGDIVQDADRRVYDAAISRVRDFETRLSRTPTDAAQAGTEVRRAFDGAVTGLMDVRRNNARSAFGALGSTRTIEPRAFTAEIESLVNDLDVRGGGDATATLVNRLRSIREQVSDGDLATPQEFQRWLEIYGRASRGQGAIFQDIDKSQQRMIAGRLYRALNDDLNNAAATGGAELRAARDGYRVDSQAIDEWERSALGQYLGYADNPAPELVAQRLKSMKPTQFQETVTLLDRVDPDLSGRVRRSMIGDAFDKAWDSGSAMQSRLGNPVAPDSLGFNPKTFMGELRKLPLWDTLSGREQFDAQMIVSALQRLPEKADYQSWTQPLTSAKELVQLAAQASIGLDPLTALKLVASTVGPRRVAEALFTDEGRRALRTLAVRNSAPEAVTRAVALLGVMSIDEPGDENTRPNSELSAPQSGDWLGQLLNQAAGQPPPQP
jgi:hypothetical protein